MGRKYLETVQHSNTRRRYACSRNNLISFFGDETQLNHISAARIEEFVRARRGEKVKAATINRDLQFLRQLLKQAERERYIARSPFDLRRFSQNESKERRKPHILTWEEQEKLLAAAQPRIRILTVIGVETGMRTGEMLGLRWQDVNFLERRASSGEEQERIRNSNCTDFRTLQIGTAQVAESRRH